MRITMLVTQSQDSPSGTGRFFPLAKALVQLGHDVTILALHHDYQNAEHRIFDWEGVHVRYVAQMHVRKVGNQKLYYPPLVMLWVAFVATLKLAWWALRTPADMIQVCKSQPMNGLAAWWAHIWKRIAVILDSDDYEAGSNRFSGKWQRRVVGWFEDWTMSFSQGIIAGNTFIEERYQRLGYPAERIMILSNGVDRERFAMLLEDDVDTKIDDLRQQLHIEPTDQVVVYVGSMSGTDHPVDMLLSAFAQVVQEIPDAFLLLVGAGEDFDAFRDSAGELGVTSRTLFTGRVPVHEVPWYYALGKVSVDPRRDTEASQSSLSLKLVESIAAGVPCISTDIGDRAKLLDGAGIAVKPNDEQALYEVLLNVLQDDVLYERLFHRTQAIRHNVYWEHRAVLLQAFYVQLGLAKD